MTRQIFTGILGSRGQRSQRSFEGIPIKVGTIDRHEVHGKTGDIFVW